jgi:glycosyltransferase involved in cell wall biosynthesis
VSGSVSSLAALMTTRDSEIARRSRVQTRFRADRAEVSVIVPVINETTSLEETISVLVEENGADLAELVVVVAERTTPESLAVIDGLLARFPDLLWVHTQTLPFIGGAIREAFDLVIGRYTVLMASDLETDPHLVRRLVGTIRESGADVVTASRWASGGRFEGYHSVKLVLNFLFQRLMSLLFLSRLSDMTYGFRIFRTEPLRQIHWAELRHPFLLETLLRPLRLGMRVQELPVTWTARREGESQMTLATYWGYVRIALEVRLRPRRASRRTA